VDTEQAVHGKSCCKEWGRIGFAVVLFLVFRVPGETQLLTHGFDSPGYGCLKVISQYFLMSQ